MPADGRRRGLASLAVLLACAFCDDAAALPLRSRQQTIESFTTIPEYVLEYAPHLYLSSREQWWPTDVASFLPNVVPLPSSSVAGSATFQTLASLSSNTYLTTTDEDASSDTEWLRSEAGKPNATGYSEAPATIIVAPKVSGIVDAFYFAFYAYNAGPS